MSEQYFFNTFTHEYIHKAEIKPKDINKVPKLINNRGHTVINFKLPFDKKPSIEFPEMKSEDIGFVKHNHEDYYKFFFNFDTRNSNDKKIVESFLKFEKVYHTKDVVEFSKRFRSSSRKGFVTLVKNPERNLEDYYKEIINLKQNYKITARNTDNTKIIGINGDNLSFDFLKNFSFKAIFVIKVSDIVYVPLSGVIKIRNLIEYILVTDIKPKEVCPRDLFNDNDKANFSEQLEIAKYLYQG